MRLGATALLVATVQCTAPPPPCSPDLSTDSLNCGACGNVCPPGTRCESGGCTATCAGDICAGACVDTNSNAQHCGACGKACTAQHALPLCIAGACTHGPCESGWLECDGDATNGCEKQGSTCFASRCPGAWCSLHGLSADGRRALIGAQEVLGSVGFSLFLYERERDTFTRLSVFADGGAAIGIASPAAISGDGERAAFIFDGPPLAADDTNLTPDLYIVDIGVARPMLFPNSGALGDVLSLSHDGRVLSQADFAHAVVRDLASGAERLLDTFNGAPLSGDGKWVGLSLRNLLGPPQAFVLELDGGIPLPAWRGGELSTSSSPVLSFDAGRYAFASQPGVWVSAPDGGLIAFYGGRPSLSSDGRILAYSAPDDLNRPTCLVVELDALRVLQTTAPLPRQLEYCIPTLSGDGRTLGIDDLRGSVYFLPVPAP